jgi:hypothetical protein
MPQRIVRELSSDERAELERIKREKIGRVAMRAHMVLLADVGLSPPDIAGLHNTTRRDVFRWIERFNNRGPDGLFDQRREGHVRSIDEEVERGIEAYSQAESTKEGANSSLRTVAQIANRLENLLETDIHPTTIENALRRLDASELESSSDYEDRRSRRSQKKHKAKKKSKSGRRGYSKPRSAKSFQFNSDEERTFDRLVFKIRGQMAKERPKVKISNSMVIRSLISLALDDLEAGYYSIVDFVIDEIEKNEKLKMD